MIKTGCQCFLCRHKDEPRLVAAYCQGLLDGSKEFIKWAKDNNVPYGSIENQDLSGLYTRYDWNAGETAAYMTELPNIEEE